MAYCIRFLRDSGVTGTGSAKEGRVNDMRLIDADALFIAVDVGDTDVWQVDADGWGTGGYSTDTMKSMIEKAPTIDAVPVVRCKDCYLHGECMTEDAFHWSGIHDPYCAAGKKVGGGDG
jgi:hypothetical protein